MALLLACARAQSTPASPEVERQNTELERIRGLVEAGALPRKALHDAQSAIDEARDRDILRATLYGNLTLEEFTEEQARTMIAAAERQLARQQERIDGVKKQIAQGVRPQTALTPYLEELDHVRKVHDAAVGRARLVENLAAMVRAEQEMEARMAAPAQDDPRFLDRYEGNGVFARNHYQYIERSFQLEFLKPLPVSAMGETAVHRSMGFDHAGRVDVAVNPDSKEGLWLRRHLEILKIPYFAFRGAVPGQSTGAHIHIGPPSSRLRAD